MSCCKTGGNREALGGFHIAKTGQPILDVYIPSDRVKRSYIYNGCKQCSQHPQAFINSPQI